MNITLSTEGCGHMPSAEVVCHNDSIALTGL